MTVSAMLDWRKVCVLIAGAMLEWRKVCVLIAGARLEWRKVCVLIAGARLEWRENLCVLVADAMLEWRYKLCVLVAGGGALPSRLKEGSVTVLTPASCASRWGSTVNSNFHICILDFNSIHGACNVSTMSLPVSFFPYCAALLDAMQCNALWNNTMLTCYWVRSSQIRTNISQSDMIQLQIQSVQNNEIKCNVI